MERQHTFPRPRLGPGVQGPVVGIGRELFLERLDLSLELEHLRALRPDQAQQFQPSELGVKVPEAASEGVFMVGNGIYGEVVKGTVAIDKRAHEDTDGGEIPDFGLSWGRHKSRRCQAPYPDGVQ